ncbi:hypothetical protein QWZ08_04430 [Ferruginibacter paludis]|uniref:hypothetical protein n=1 Tax=Ferruginibacter paludis TaxID=1310417 RepID=UPI0025B3AC22|nr:hypothetical protein [Ferruginibacter paludis]MDN3654862.1 hypothetical protein [Ferruginibacter paludis]
MTDENLNPHAWSHDEIAQVSELNDKLLYYFDTAFTHERFDWNSEGADIFDINIVAAPNSSRVFKEILYSLQIAAEKKDVALEAIQKGKLEELLSPALKDQFVKAKEQIAEFTNQFDNQKNESFQLERNLFLRVLYAFEVMAPKLSDILSEDAITAETIVEKYIELRKDEILIQCFQPILASGKTELLDRIGNSSSKVKEIIASFKDYQSLFAVSFYPSANPDEAKNFNIKATDPEFTKTYAERFAKRTALLKQCEGLRTTIEDLNNKYKELNPAVQNVANALEDFRAKNDYLASKIIPGEGDYVDVMRSAASKYFVRLRFKKGTFGRLSIDKKIEFTEASASIVYWIAGEEEPEFEKMTQDQKITDLNGKAGKLITEIPLGLTIRDINLSKEMPANQSYILKASDPSISIGIQLPKKGIWNQFTYDASTLQGANQLLSLPVVLGVNLKRLIIDPDTWQISFGISWTPQSFFEQIFNNDPTLTSFSVTLDDLLSRNPEEFRAALREAAITKIWEQIKTAANDSKLNQLKTFFNSERVYNFTLDPFSKNNEYISGKLQLENVRFPILNVNVPHVTIRFGYSLLQNEAQLTMSRISLVDALPSLRDKIKTELQSEITKITDVLSESVPGVVTHAAAVLNISSFEFNLEDKSFKLMCEGKSYLFKTLPEMLAVIKEVATNYVRNYKDILIDYSRTAAEKAVIKAGQEALRRTCESLNNSVLPSFGLPFKVVQINCVSGKVEGVARYEDIALKFIRENDQFKVVSADKKQIADLLIKQLNETVGLKDKVIFEADVTDEIIIRARLKITEINFDGIIHTITINTQTSAIDSRTELKDLQTAALNVITKYFADFKGKVKIADYADMELSVAGIDLLTHKLTLNGKMVFHGDINVDVPIEIDYATGKIDINQPKNLEGQIAGILLQNLFAALMDDENAIKINPIDFKAHTISGTADIKIWDQIKLPTVKFTLRENKIDFDFKPSLTVPIIVPIAPPYCSLIDPTIILDLDNKELSFKGDFSMGIDQSVRGIAKLVKIKGDFNIPYSKKDIGKVDYNGDLILVSFFPLNKSRGVITIIPEAEVTLSEGTTGMAQKILKLDKTTRFGKTPNGDYSFSTIGTVDLLHVATGALDVTGAIDTLSEAIKLSGTGRFGLPVGTLTGSVGTSFVYSPLQGFIKDPFMKVGGDVTLCGFDLSKFSIEANEHFAEVHFYVMGLGLTLHFPGVDAISVTYIRDEIIKLLKRMLSPEELAKALLNLPKMDLSLGGGPEGNDSREFNDKEGGLDGNADGNPGGNLGGNLGGNNGDNDKPGGGRPGGNNSNKPSNEKDRNKTGVSGKLSSEIEIANMDGNSDIGYTFVRYNDLSRKEESVYIAISNKLCVPLKDYRTYVSACNPGLDFSSYYCFIYLNNSNEPQRLPFDFKVVKNEKSVSFVLKYPSRNEQSGYYQLAKGECVILGFSAANMLLDNKTNYSLSALLPAKEGIDDFKMSDKFCLNLTRSTVDPKTYSIGGNSIITNELAFPAYNFILAYNDNEAKAFLVTASSFYNFLLTADCNKTSKSLSWLYQTKHVVDYDDLYHLNFQMATAQTEKSVAATSITSTAGNGHNHPPCFITNAYRRVFNQGKVEYVEEKKKTNLSTDYPYAYGQIAFRDFSSELFIYIIQIGNEEYWIAEESDTPIAVAEIGSDYFKDYIEFTNKIVVDLDAASLFQIISSCETEVPASNILQALRSHIKDGNVERSAVYKFVDYANLKIANKPISDDYFCNVIKLDTSVRVTPITSPEGDKWKTFFVVGNEKSIKTINFTENDLSRALGIVEKPVTKSTFIENPLLGSLLSFLYSSGTLQNKILFAADKNRAGWISLASPSHLYLLDNQNSMKPFVQKELLYPAGFFSLEGNRGDFFNFPTVIANHQVFFDRLFNLLITDSSANVAIDFMETENHVRQLLAFVKTSKDVLLLIDDKDGKKIKTEKTIERSLFEENLKNAMSQAVIDENLSNIPRIRESNLLEEQFKTLATFILSAFKSDGKKVNSVINPLALFNKSGIKTIYK